MGEPREITQSPNEARDLYTIPSSSSWFRWDEIHETERRSLPEFFDGYSISRNSRVYKEYRDFIINKYREDTSRRLGFTVVRKSLVGDVGSLHKVFMFLDRWGLINFGAPLAPSDSGHAGGPVVVVEEGALAGVQVVPAPTPPGLAPVPAVGAGENGFKLPPLTSFSDVFGDWMPGNGPVCGDCGFQCVSGQYQSMKGGFVKCPKCFEDENNMEGKSVDEKLKDHVDGDGNQVSSVWTDAETLLLLEAVLKHGDDWDLIAQHVRTKTKLDCIARLIQLPFGEHMLGTIGGKFDNRHSSSPATDGKVPIHALSELPYEPNKTDGHHRTDTDEEKVAEDSTPVHPSKRRCFPSILDFTDSLMKQVAFLSTVGGPDVTSAAAEAAVSALCSENPCAGKAFGIDEDEVIYKIGMSSTNYEQESFTKAEDWDVERHKQTDLPEAVPEKNFIGMTFRIRAAIAAALGAAAARAKLLADQEEREIEHLMASIIETQMRKLQYKMKHFDELELIMEKEHTQIQQLKESILEDWVTIVQQAFRAGIPRWKDHGFPRSLLSNIL